MADENTPLVLLYGLLCDQRLWHHQVEALAPMREVLVPDLSLDTSIEAMARRVLEQAPPRFALAALSMGGYVAMEIMRLAPERVLKLALFDTMARPDSQQRTQMRRDLLGLARIGKFKGVTPHLLPRLMHPRCVGGPVSQLVQAMAAAVGQEGFMRQQGAIIDRMDYLPVLAQVKVPTLVVVGQQDEITPLAESEVIHQAIAGSRLVVIPDCGHLPPLEHPQLTDRLLAEWLAA